MILCCFCERGRIMLIKLGFIFIVTVRIWTILDCSDAKMTPVRQKMFLPWITYIHSHILTSLDYIHMFLHTYFLGLLIYTFLDTYFLRLLSSCLHTSRLILGPNFSRFIFSSALAYSFFVRCLKQTVLSDLMYTYYIHACWYCFGDHIKTMITNRWLFSLFNVSWGRRSFQSNDDPRQPDHSCNAWAHQDFTKSQQASAHGWDQLAARSH